MNFNFKNCILLIDVFAFCAVALSGEIPASGISTPQRIIFVALAVANIVAFFRDE